MRRPNLVTPTHNTRQVSMGVLSARCAAAMSSIEFAAHTGGTSGITGRDI